MKKTVLINNDWEERKTETGKADVAEGKDSVYQGLRHDYKHASRIEEVFEEYEEFLSRQGKFLWTKSTSTAQNGLHRRPQREKAFDKNE